MNIMKFIGISILSIIVLFVSCGSSKTSNVEKINLSSYSGIEVRSGIEVYFSYGRSYTAQIDSPEPINVYVENGVLKVNRKGKSNKRVKVYLTANNIESIALSGGSKFSTDELKNKTGISIAASGGSSFDIKKLESRVSNIAVSGGSRYNIDEVRSETLNIASSGGSTSSLDIKSARSVSVAVSGGSNVVLTGSVESISVVSSGNANVDIVNLKYKDIQANTSGRGRIQRR